jgi:DNA-binding response OmpR family regulator
MTRIIVVEDESIIAMDLEEILGGAGFHVVGVVRSLPEAVAALSEHPTDLMVVDLDTGGLELPLPWFGVPVVLLTSYRARLHGHVFPLAHRCACPYVTKPFLSRPLLAAIECVLRQRPYGGMRHGTKDLVSTGTISAEIYESIGGKNGISRNPTIPEDESACLVAS